MKKFKSEYITQWEYDRDVFLFDTILFPYFRGNKMCLHKAWKYVREHKENKPVWYRIMSRFLQQNGR